MRHWSLGRVSGFELFGCVHLLGHAHWLGMFACKYLARDEEHAKDKDLAAYGILWDTPMATGYSHLLLTFFYKGVQIYATFISGFFAQSGRKFSLKIVDLNFLNTPSLADTVATNAPRNPSAVVQGAGLGPKRQICL